MRYLVALAVVLGVLNVALGEPPALKRGVNVREWLAPWTKHSDAEYARLLAVDAPLIARMGFDHVRLPFDASHLYDPAAPTTFKPRIARLDAAIDALLAAGLTVVVNTHPEDSFKEQLHDPARFDAFVAFWSALAGRLSRHDPQRLLLEPFNEPRDRDTYWPAGQKKLYAAVRAAAPDHTIVVTAHHWSSIDETVKMDLFDDANVIYTFHCYDPFHFTHQQATWSWHMVRQFRQVPYPLTADRLEKVLPLQGSDEARRILTWEASQNRDAAWLATRIDKIARWAKEKNVRIWCGEFGAIVHAPADDRATYHRDMRTILEERGIGWAVWDLRNGAFKLIEERDGKVVAVNEGVLQGLGVRWRGE